MMTRPPILSTDQPQEESVEQIMTGAPDYTAEQMDAMYVTPEEEIAALKARVAELKDAYARSEAGSRAMLAACDLERKRRHAAEADLRTAARELLRAYMRELSEGYFLAGWHIHLDAELRRCVEENDRRLGLGHMTTGEFSRLLTLHEQAGGWWRWNANANREVFVEDDDEESEGA